MTDSSPEPIPAPLNAAPNPSEAEVARKNLVWGWTLIGAFCVLFAGTFGVAYVWMWLS